MRYKLSFFNELIMHNDNAYLWNIRSGALIRLDDDGKRFVSSFDGCEVGSNEFRLLKKHGMIVPFEYDEVGKILFDEQKHMYNRYPETVFFTIAPGMDCNYACVYCFEKGRERTQIMTAEIVSKVIEFIKKKASGNPNLKRLNVKWFGGEPLLHLDIIRKVSKELIGYCNSLGIVYDAGIITNGSLLTAAVCEELKQLQVKKAQITIDGLEEDYCRNKGTLNTSFKAAIDNICYACERLSISIRINIPNNDAHKAISVTDYLFKEKSLFGKVGIYFAFVRNYENCSTNDDYKLFSPEYIKWLAHMIENYNWRKQSNNKSTVKATSCASIRISNYCIGPKGELYKCEHCIGVPEQSIGNVFQGEFFNKYERDYMDTLSSGKRPQCLKCKYLPICMGGCANDTVEQRTGFDCETFRNHQIKLKLMFAGL